MNVDTLLKNIIADLYNLMKFTEDRKMLLEIKRKILNYKQIQKNINDLYILKDNLGNQLSIK